MRQVGPAGKEQADGCSGESIRSAAFDMTGTSTDACDSRPVGRAALDELPRPAEWEVADTLQDSALLAVKRCDQKLEAFALTSPVDSHPEHGTGGKLSGVAESACRPDRVWIHRRDAKCGIANSQQCRLQVSPNLSMEIKHRAPMSGDIVGLGA